MNRVGRLLHIAVKESRLVVGLMSGTSVDGIDAALVEITGHGEAAAVKLLAFDSYPFPPELRARVFRLFNPREARVDAICQLDFLLGEVFAAAVERLLRDHNIDRDDVDIVASAGQTIWHDPEPVVVTESVDWIDHPIVTRSTFAIGQSAVIAERTGIHRRRPPRARRRRGRAGGAAHRLRRLGPAARREAWPLRAEHRRHRQRHVPAAEREVGGSHTLLS